MKYIVESSRNIEDAATAFEAAVKAQDFGILHVYDLKETLKGKGFDLDNECRIYEVCNPQQAVNVLDQDMAMNLALPCRVSIYQSDGKTRIGMIRPTRLLSVMSDSPALQEIAEQVEAAMVRMIDAAR